MHPDLLQRLAAPIRVALERRLVAAFPGAALLVGALLDVAALVLLGALLAAACRALTPAAGSAAPGPAGAHARVRLAAGVVAAGLLAWIVRHPGMQLDSLFGRCDHLVLCAAIGLAAGSLSPTWRKTVLATVSVRQGEPRGRRSPSSTRRADARVRAPGAVRRRRPAASP